MTVFGYKRRMQSAVLTAVDLETIAEHLSAISSRIPLRPIKTRHDYEMAVSALNALLDAGGADEKNPLALLVTLLGDFIGDYEDAQPEVG